MLGPQLCAFESGVCGGGDGAQGLEHTSVTEPHPQFSSSFILSSRDLTGSSRLSRKGVCPCPGGGYGHFGPLRIRRGWAWDPASWKVLVTGWGEVEPFSLADNRLNLWPEIKGLCRPGAAVTWLFCPLEGTASGFLSLYPALDP